MARKRGDHNLIFTQHGENRGDEAATWDSASCPNLYRTVRNFGGIQVLRKVLQWSMGAAIVAYIAYFLIQNQAVFHRTYAGTIYHLGALFACILGSWIVATLQTLLPLRELGVQMGIAENLALTVATSFCNYLPLRAGTVLRLQYIKSVHGVSYLQCGGILGARALLLVWATGATGLAGAGCMALTGRAVPWELFVLFAGILLAGVAPFFIPYDRLLPSEGRLSGMARELTQAMVLIRGNRHLTALYLCLVLLQFILFGTRMAVAFNAMGHCPTPWVYALISPVATLSSFVNVTPGDLGLREWIVGMIAAGLGTDYAAGIFASSLDRAVLMAMTFAFGSLATALVVIRLGRKAGTGRPSLGGGRSAMRSLPTLNTR